MYKSFVGAYYKAGQVVRLDRVEQSLDNLFGMIKRLDIISTDTYKRSVQHWHKSETKKFLCQI